MDEAIKIYDPSHRIPYSQPVDLNRFRSKSNDTKTETPRKHYTGIRRILHEDRLKTKILEKKFPWYPILMNWLVLALLFIASVECFAWGVQNHTERQAGELAAVALAEYQEEQAALEAEKQAALLAEQSSEAARREKDTVLLAKLAFGIHNFVEKYNYSENDIRTYLECVPNRVLSQTNGFASVTTLEEAILQKDQWVGFSESNQVVSQYYRIAAAVVNDFYDGKVRPCSSDFCWAELTRNGVWLKNEYSDNKYVQTWRYTV